MEAPELVAGAVAVAVAAVVLAADVEAAPVDAAVVLAAGVEALVPAAGAAPLAAVVPVPLAVPTTAAAPAGADTAVFAVPSSALTVIGLTAIVPVTASAATFNPKFFLLMSFLLYPLLI